MEEEAVRCDEVPAEGEVLGVPPAPFHCSCYPANSPWQGSPVGLQGKAGDNDFRFYVEILFALRLKYAL